MLRERLAPLTSQHPDTVARTPGGPLAAALASQQVTQNQADALDEEPDAANRLAASLSNLAVRLAEPGRREGALAAIREAAGTYRELAAARASVLRPGRSHPARPAGRRHNGLGAARTACAAGDRRRVRPGAGK